MGGDSRQVDRFRGFSGRSHGLCHFQEVRLRLPHISIFASGRDGYQTLVNGGKVNFAIPNSASRYLPGLLFPVDCSRSYLPIQRMAVKETTKLLSKWPRRRREAFIEGNSHQRSSSITIVMVLVSDAVIQFQVLSQGVLSCWILNTTLNTFFAVTNGDQARAIFYVPSSRSLPYISVPDSCVRDRALAWFDRTRRSDCMPRTLPDSYHYVKHLAQGSIESCSLVACVHGKRFVAFLAPQHARDEETKLVESVNADASMRRLVLPASRTCPRSMRH